MLGGAGAGATFVGVITISQEEIAKDWGHDRGIKREIKGHCEQHSCLRRTPLWPPEQTRQLYGAYTSTVSPRAERLPPRLFYRPKMNFKTLVILLSCTATARACESPDQEGGRGKATIIGGIAGAAVLPTFLLAIGLTPAGPVAGGWFAASQGAGVAAGSWMGSWQSMAMFGSLAKSLAVGAGFTATGAGAGALTASSERLAGVRSLTRKIAGTTVAGARTAAAYTSAKAAKISSYASDTLRGD